MCSSQGLYPRGWEEEEKPLRTGIIVEKRENNPGWELPPNINIPRPRSRVKLHFSLKHTFWDPWWERYSCYLCQIRRPGTGVSQELSELGISGMLTKPPQDKTGIPLKSALNLSFPDPGITPVSPLPGNKPGYSGLS